MFTDGCLCFFKFKTIVNTPRSVVDGAAKTGVFCLTYYGMLQTLGIDGVTDFNTSITGVEGVINLEIAETQGIFRCQSLDDCFDLCFHV